MAYCSKCGVEVEAHRKNCPLCETPIHRYDEDIELSPLWPVQKEIPTLRRSIKRLFLVLPLQVIFLITTLLLIIVDYRMNRALTWSRYPIATIISLFSITLGVVLVGRSKILTIGWITASILAMLFMLDSLNGMTWFLTLGLPLTLLVALYCTLTIISAGLLGKRYGAQLTVQALIVTLLCMGIDTVIAHASGTVTLSWSLIVAAPLMVLFFLGIIGIFVLKRFIDFEKYLHR